MSWTREGRRHQKSFLRGPQLAEHWGDMSRHLGLPQQQWRHCTVGTQLRPRTTKLMLHFHTLWSSEVASVTKHASGCWGAACQDLDPSLIQRWGPLDMQMVLGSTIWEANAPCLPTPVVRARLGEATSQGVRGEAGGRGSVNEIQGTGRVNGWGHWAPQKSTATGQCPGRRPGPLLYEQGISRMSNDRPVPPSCLRVPCNLPDFPSRVRVRLG